MKSSVSNIQLIYVKAENHSSHPLQPKIKAAGYSQMFINIYKTTGRHNKENGIYSKNRKNFKSHGTAHA
jgi:hypothetical protein